jgi:hypothetical protein
MALSRVVPKYLESYISGSRDLGVASCIALRTQWPLKLIKCLIVYLSLMALEFLVCCVYGELNFKVLRFSRLSGIHVSCEGTGHI